MNERLQAAFAPESFREQGHALIDQLADYLEQAQTRQLGQTIPWMSPADALAYWQADFAKGPGGDPLALFQDILARSTHLHDPRYMGHQVAPPLPLAVLAGLLKHMLNNGMAVYEMGMVANPHEHLVMAWLAQQLGFGEEAGGLITSGGTLANLTALLTARALLPTEQVWRDGVQSRLAIMVSTEAHYCIDRAARIMGLGEAGVIKIPVDAEYRIRTAALEGAWNQAIAQGLKVFAVVGSACSTSTGSYDDLEALAAFCGKHQLWLHVDAAHGGAAALSPAHRHLLAGIEQADSVIIDFHKMMLTPALATGLVYRNGLHAFATFHQRAQYLWDNPTDLDWYNSGKRTFECTKSMLATLVYTLLRVHGPEIFAANVATLYDLAQAFAQEIRQRPAFELAVDPQANLVCFRLHPPTGWTANAFNSQVRRKLTEVGQYYIVQTELNGAVYLRTSLMNPLSTLADLGALLDALEETGQTLENSLDPKTER